MIIFLYRIFNPSYGITFISRWPVFQPGALLIKGFNGNIPKISKFAFISEAAYIIKDIEIQDNTSVWLGAVVRGDLGRIIIDYNTAVEDNYVIHSGAISSKNSILDVNIGNNVFIGHGAVVSCHQIR